MRSVLVPLVGLSLTLGACQRVRGTEAPPEGWANLAPTRVEQALERPAHQLLRVSQNQLEAWVRIPNIGAKPGEYVLLGQGRPMKQTRIDELDLEAEAIVDIAHAQVVDRETAHRSVASQRPEDAVSIADVYGELKARSGAAITVHGVAVKVSNAVGWYWVHLRDGTGSEAEGTHDLTVQTKTPVTRGERVGFRGRLEADVDLGFGYHYDALVKAAERL